MNSGGETSTTIERTKPGDVLLESRGQGMASYRDKIIAVTSDDTWTYITFEGHSKTARGRRGERVTVLSVDDR